MDMQLARYCLQSIAIVALGVMLISLGTYLVAPKASALTTEEIKVQIQELMTKISELTRQLNVLQGQEVKPDAGMGMPHRVCALFNPSTGSGQVRNLSQGTQGDDVRGLQEFLSTEGFLSANATGYFGPMTAQAVAKWQASQGVSAVGNFGPMSRERIKIWCGAAHNDARFNAAPQRGAAPLKVKFTSNKFSTHDAGEPQHYVDFGDGTEPGRITCQNFVGPDLGSGRCAEWGIEHTYVEEGTYAAVLWRHEPEFVASSRVVNPERTALARLQIYVGDAPVCTKEYTPVCGQHNIVCITTPCNPIQQTYSNRCMMNADGATFVHEGQCRSDYDPANDSRCKSWYDGCNTCSRNAPGEPAMCTLRECGLKSMTKPYCTAWFNDSGNKPPTISSFSGPTTLSVNQTGTWMINASDPENSSLTYSITWGDEKYYPAPMALSAAREAFVQTTTFTHAYNASGTYTVSIIVRDAGGKEANTSSTVRVGDVQTNCTMEYAPVCGQPPEPACRYSIPACMRPTPGPQTYGNRCLMNAAGATFIKNGRCDEPVACTADAMQCPDGTYVGRTGPNCQFVCPTTTSGSSCPTGYGWCPAGPAGNSCALLNANGTCPITR